VLIEHDMNVVFGVVDSITVLHQGQELATGSPTEIRTHPEVRRVYMGELVGEAR
jgi:branched-chain amino acid transport system ATP-binding protein